MHTAQLALVQALEKHGVDCALDEFGVIDASFECFEVSITARPHYCDRGRWMVLATSNDPTLSDIDWADGFPRYYFNASCLVIELMFWREARMKGLNRQPPTDSKTP